MQKHRLFPLLARSAAAGLLIGSLVTSAQARGHTTTARGSRGGIYQRHVERGPGYASRSTTATNTAGQTVSHFQSRSADASTGSLRRSSSTTLADGRTANRNFDTHRTDTGHTTSASAKGINGKTAAYNSTTTRTDTGYTRQATVLGPNGATGSKQVNVSTQNGVTTRTVTTSRTPPQS